jgi:hypothetical protein
VRSLLTANTNARAGRNAGLFKGPWVIAALCEAFLRVGPYKRPCLMAGLCDRTWLMVGLIETARVLAGPCDWECLIAGLYVRS